jgi:hypothetical protein
MDRSRIAVPALALALLVGVGAPAPAANTASASASLARPGTAVPHMVLPFIHDDWTRAMALAKQRKLPVFVEAWAPW